MFDLNDKGFNGTVIFNNGQGGKVENVTISVEKKSPEQPDTYPAYKLIVDDGTGGKINQGFYYPVPKAGDTPDQVEKAMKREVGRVIHVARAVLGADAVLPSVSTAVEAYDSLFKLIKEGSVGQTFNVFASYGTTGYASQYLGLRYFDFIENTETPTGRLAVKNNDLLERVQEDKPANSEVDSMFDAPQTNAPIEKWGA